MPKKTKVLALPEIEDAIVSKDFFCKVCKLSKRHAEYLLQSGLVPCVRNGRKTRSYRIRREDVLHYLIQREQHPEKYQPPKNWYSTKLKNKMIGPMRTLPQVPADAITGYYETALTAFPDVLSIVQVCDLTGYQRHTVLSWIHDGRLRSFYIGQKHQIPKVFLLEFVASDFYAKIVDKSKRHQTAIRFTAKALKAKEV